MKVEKDTVESDNSLRLKLPPQLKVDQKLPRSPVENPTDFHPLLISHPSQNHHQNLSRKPGYYVSPINFTSLQL
jgi:hypothetical protein